MPDTVIEVEQLTKKFCRDLKQALWYGVHDILAELAVRNGSSKPSLRKNEFYALRSVSFQVRRGECVAFLGPNGAGKSTLLKMISGLLRPDAGTIRLRGRIGALIALGTGFNPILTGRENIYVNAAVLGLSKLEVDARLDEIIDFSEIPAFIDAPVQSYSSGMKVRLGFSVAAHLRPEILLVDEVLAVGDVGFRMKCYQHILKLIDDGTSIVLVSHNVHQLSRVSNRAIVLGGGEKRFDGPLMEGISCYQSLLQSQLDAGHHHRKKQKARIEAVELVDENDSVRTQFQTGETLRVRITLGAAEAVRGGRIIANVESPSAGILGAFSTPYTNFQFDIDPQQTVIQLSLPDVPLLVGTYNINLNLYGPEITDVYDRRVPGASFDIVGPPTNAFGFGVNHVFKFNHHWKRL